MRWLKRAVISGLAVLLAIQLVPYGWWHDNPPVVSAAVWPDAASEELARVACYDCHSHETRWPPHTYVAPISWLTRWDVEEGRDDLNFSDWDDGDADDAAEAILDGEMPPWRYTLVHRDASLSEEEQAALVTALVSMEARD